MRSPRPAGLLLRGEGGSWPAPRARLASVLGRNLGSCCGWRGMAIATQVPSLRGNRLWGLPPKASARAIRSVLPRSSSGRSANQRVKITCALCLIAASSNELRPPRTWGPTKSRGPTGRGLSIRATACCLAARALLASEESNRRYGDRDRQRNVVLCRPCCPRAVTQWLYRGFTLSLLRVRK